MQEDFDAHERLVKELNDHQARIEYARPYDKHPTGVVPRILGGILVGFGNLVYGPRPSYSKFKAIEIVARIPYQSWESAAYTLLSAFYGNEKRAIELTKLSAFARMAHDNETMHVVVMTNIAKKHRCVGFFRHLLIPLLFAFIYYWAIYVLYLFSRKASLELNYLFEDHAFNQYSEFLKTHGEKLMHEPIMSDFLVFYGRHVRTEYEFFESVRNDELIHRNRSIRELETAR